MKQLIDFTNRKVIVTGASGGIGQAVSLLLSELGAQVILIGRNMEHLKRNLNQMPNNSHKYFVYDLMDLNGIGKLIENIVEYDGKKLDGLVHCAGVSLRLPIRNLNYENMDVVMKTNFYSFVELVKHYSRKKYNNGGSIVAVSSLAATEGSVGQTAYAASKAAIDISVKTLSKELFKKNIRINSVRPGFINTSMLEGLKNKTGSDLLGQNQLLGIGEPVDVANLIIYLLSDASRFITGANYTIDGGSC